MRSLKDAETLIRFIDNLREGVYITNAAGRILDANPAFLDMFGVASLDALREHTAESLMLDPTRRAEELAILDAVGAVREFELEIVRPDGSTRTALDTAYLVVDAETGERLYHGILVDITDRKVLERQLRELATRDPLTGCFNRRFLQDAMASVRDDDGPISAIVVDIDHFKQINDHYGHDMGDRLLIQTARYLQHVVRTEDPVIRSGGDEFVILLPGLDERLTRQIVRRLRRSGPESAPVSFTIGWAERTPGEPLEATIRRADQDLIRVRVETRHPPSRR